MGGAHCRQAPGRPDTAGQVGELLGILQGLAITASGPVDAWYTQAPRPGIWGHAGGPASSAGATWSSKLASASPLILDLTALAVPVPQRRPIVCHRDFTPDNVLPRAPDGKLVVLDWENAGPPHAERELGYVLLAWTATGQHFDTEAACAL